MGCWQCLPLSVVHLKGKHCRKPHCHNGVVDAFGHKHHPLIIVYFNCANIIYQNLFTLQSILFFIFANQKYVTIKINHWKINSKSLLFGKISSYFAYTLKLNFYRINIFSLPPIFLDCITEGLLTHLLILEKQLD